jgi:hypothetical protein
MAPSMRTYGLEEHVATADVVGAWKTGGPAQRTHEQICSKSRDKQTGRIKNDLGP